MPLNEAIKEIQAREGGLGERIVDIRDPPGGRSVRFGSAPGSGSESLASPICSWARRAKCHHEPSLKFNSRRGQPGVLKQRISKRR